MDQAVVVEPECFRSLAASWSASDIKTVDDMLEVFKGRILRDDWVPQARLLGAGSSVQAPTRKRPSFRAAAHA